MYQSSNVNFTVEFKIVRKWGGGDTLEEANSEINKAIVYCHLKKNDIITIEPTVEIIGGKLYI